MFPTYSVEAQAPWVYCYALILLVTVVEVKQSVISDPVCVRCGPVSPGAVNSHTPQGLRPQHPLCYVMLM